MGGLFGAKSLVIRQIPVPIQVGAVRSSASSSPETNSNRASEERGAHARIRTGDLFLTKEMLYRLSYVGAP